MLSKKRGKKLNEYVDNYTVFDLETTGISAKTDAVIEISAVKVREGKVVEEFTSLVNPGRPIPFYASNVNGITDEMVADAADFESVLKEFLDFIADDVLVGHNIHNFDMKFIYRDVKVYWDSSIDNNYVDTLPMAKALLTDLPHHKLTDLAEYYGISSDGAHRALNDCRMNQQVFEALGKEMAEGKLNKKAAIKSGVICPDCGAFLRKRTGRFGDFLGCSSYPMCKYTRSV